MTDSSWKIFTNSSGQKDIDWQNDLPEPPSWRRFDQSSEERKRKFIAPDNAIEVVNAALYLRRPLLVTGNPGTGKSSLAYAIAHELKLGEVLKWSITTKTTLRDGLYRYDAIARLRESQRNKLPQNGESKQTSNEVPEDIGKFIQLGPLGTALIPSAEANKPRILLIDEIDKSDIDLPNDLLNVFEDGEFDIPELVRIKEKTQKGVKVATYYRQEAEEPSYTVRNGIVKARTFPFVIMTSNDERDFPPAFLRRCLRLEMPKPKKEDLLKIVNKHLKFEDGKTQTKIEELVEQFLQYRDDQDYILATDQLLNAIYLLTQSKSPTEEEEKALKKKLFQSLGE